MIKRFFLALGGILAWTFLVGFLIFAFFEGAPGEEPRVFLVAVSLVLFLGVPLLLAHQAGELDELKARHHEQCGEFLKCKEELYQIRKRVVCSGQKHLLPDTPLQENPPPQKHSLRLVK